MILKGMRIVVEVSPWWMTMFHKPAMLSVTVMSLGFTGSVFEEKGAPVITFVPGEKR